MAKSPIDVFKEMKDNQDLSKDFTYIGKRTFVNSKNDCAIIQLVSKLYLTHSYKYWFSIHPYQIEILDKYSNSFVLLCFKNCNTNILVPLALIKSNLNIFGSSTPKNGQTYWHLYIDDGKDYESYSIRVPFTKRINLAKYIGSFILPSVNKHSQNTKDNQDLIKEYDKYDGEFVININEGENISLPYKHKKINI